MPTIRHPYFRGFLAVSLFSVLGGSPVAQAQSNPSNVPRFIRPSFAWASQAWSGDNSPYHAIRVQIDRAGAQGRLTLPVLQAYYKSWQQEQNNPLVLFRWAYASDVAVRHSHNLPPHPSPGDGAFESCPDPHTYDYERIRYLVNWPGNEIVLFPLAKRLLAHDPKDYPLQFNLAARYGGRDSPAEKAASIARAERLLAQYPNKPEIYSVLGGIYCDHWVFQKNAADAQKAIFYYNKYLQLAPPSDPWRKQAVYWIKALSRGSLHTSSQ